MPDTNIEGIVPILVTPFHDDGRIDEESLANQVAFNIAGGVHGIGIANGSELYKMNEAERDAVVRCVVEAAGGRVPVVVSTGAAGTDLSIQYSRAAKAAGAAAIMLMPPSFMPMRMEGTLAHYRAVARAVDLPIVLQDVPAATVSPQLALKLAEECPTIRTIKVETFPLTVKVEAMVSGAGDKLTILGGAAGTYFIEEMRRGSRGTMPYASRPDVFAKVWDLYQAGDRAGARTLFDGTIMAINRLTAQTHDTQVRVHKQLLHRQGVIRSTHMRGPTTPLDPTTATEVEELIADQFPEARVFTTY